MKRSTILLIIFTIISISLNATNIIVTNPNAGKLNSIINNISDIDTLVLSGEINGKDIDFIRNLNNLKYLDIENVRMIKGGQYKSKWYYISQKDNSIEERMFAYLKNLETIILPSSITQIGISAFEQCSLLKNIQIGTYVDSIKSLAFSGCSNLEKINIPINVNYIGNQCFINCGFYEIEIPKGISKIEYRTFGGCKELQKVTIYDNIKSIGSCAFSYCNNISDIYWIGSNLTWIENRDAFECGTYLEPSVRDKIYNNCIVHTPNDLSKYFKLMLHWKDFKHYQEDSMVSIENTLCNLNIYVDNNTAVIENIPLGMIISVYDINGNIIIEKHAQSESMHIPLKKGIYIININNINTKIVV